MGSELPIHFSSHTEAAGFEPARPAIAGLPDFKSGAPRQWGQHFRSHARRSTNTTAGVEPTSPALQASASPLGHIVVCRGNTCVALFDSDEERDKARHYGTEAAGFEPVRQALARLPAFQA